MKTWGHQRPLSERPRPDAEILFRRVREVAMHAPARSKRYRNWLRGRVPVPGLEFHHVCASKHGLKSSDLLAVMVTPTAHREGQHDRAWLIEQLPQAIANLLAYTSHLEEQLQHLLSDSMPVPACVGGLQPSNELARIGDETARRVMGVPKPPPRRKRGRQ